MRPAAKFHALHKHSKKVVINGPRPSPLMINKDSHLIRKPSSYSTSVAAEIKPHKQQRDPIIIYTQSPKVIHTKPPDFMALVQRLTGMARSKEEVSDATASLVQHQPQLEASENFGSSLSDGPIAVSSSRRRSSSGSMVLGLVMKRAQLLGMVKLVLRESHMFNIVILLWVLLICLFSPQIPQILFAHLN